jgi:signal transduction histidine kinase
VPSVFSDLVRYIAISDDDLALLRALEPRLAPFFPDVAERFYAALWSDPKAAAVLAGPEQVERLRRTLIDWMSTGLLGPLDDRFYEKRSRIGRRHVQIGLPHHYMFGAMSVVRTAYQERIHTLYPPDEAARVVIAVNKLIDLELAIMVHHYQLDSEEKLIARERRMQAERISAMQTMTAGLAHEVRNPLNAAKLQLELLDRRLRRESNDPRLTDPSELAQQEISRLTDLVNDFLAFARPPELQLGDHDVAVTVQKVAELERPSATAKEVELVTQLPSTPVVVRCDAAKLHQILDNLVRNAIEAAPPRGTVRVELASNEHTFTLRIVDNGPGIAEEHQARIYEPFYTTKSMGTGLGMSIVHSLVALHGGTIELDSRPGTTRFHVTLPRRQ